MLQPCSRLRSLAIAGLFLTAGASAQTAVLVGDNFRISDGLTNNIGSIAGAYNTSDNEYRMVWFDSRVVGQNDVYAQRVAADGTILGENVTIISAANTHVDPQIAYNASANNYLVTWRFQGESPGTPGFNHTFGGIVSAAGGLTMTPIDYSNAGLEPDLVYNPVSNEYFTYARDFGGGGVGTKARRIDANGQPIGGPITVAPGADAAPGGGVAHNPNANQYMGTWRNQVVGSLRGRLVNADGSTPAGGILLSPTFPDSFPCAVLFDPERDRYMVAFGDFNSGPARVQFVTGAGVLDGGPIEIFGSAQVGPVTAFDPINRVYLIVHFNNNDNRLDARLMSAAGDLLGDVFPIIGDTFWFSSQPAVVADETHGGFLVAWVDGRAIDQDRLDVFAQRIGIEADVDCAGDVDLDGDVDLSDLAALLSHFGQTGDAARGDGDLDGDRDVDLADLATLLANFGAVCP